MAEILKLQVDGKEVLLSERPGKIRRCWLAGKFYEQPMLNNIRSLRLSGVAVDAGANIGNHTIWFAAVCGLKVHAFEPILDKECSENVMLNGLDDRVMVHAVALGDRTARARHVGKGKLELHQRGEIEVRTLDSFHLDDVTLLKADVEWMEAALLRGSVDTLERCKPWVYTECQPGEREKVEAVLAPLGYVAVEENLNPNASNVVKWEARR